MSLVHSEEYKTKTLAPTSSQQDAQTRYAAVPQSDMLCLKHCGYGSILFLLECIITGLPCDLQSLNVRETPTHPLHGPYFDHNTPRNLVSEDHSHIQSTASMVHFTSVLLSANLFNLTDAVILPTILILTTAPASTLTKFQQTLSPVPLPRPIYPLRGHRNSISGITFGIIASAVTALYPSVSGSHF